MKLDEQLLTAYALNELDAAEASRVESLIAHDPEALRMVEDIRQTAEMLRDGLRHENAQALLPIQKQAVLANLAVPLNYQAADPRKITKRRWALVAASIAGLAGITAATVLLQSSGPGPVTSSRSVVSSGPIKGYILTTTAPAEPEKGKSKNVLFGDATSNSYANVPEDFSELSLGNQLAVTKGVRNTGSLASPKAHEWGAPVLDPKNRNWTAQPGIDIKINFQDLESDYSFGTRLSAVDPSSKPQTQILAYNKETRNYTAAVTDAQLQGIHPTKGKGDPAKSADFDGYYAHYRLRGVDGVQLLDPGVQGYDKQRFENEALYRIPIQPITAPAIAPNTESYAAIHDNAFLTVSDAPLSTFSIDVDTASYSNIRRFLEQGQLPPADAVRIEELLNYFPYNYPQPAKDSKDPFAASVEIAGCPWNTAHRLARVSIKGKEIAHDKRPVSNLVFLIDVSGSMNTPAKLPLVKEGLKLMVKELGENDRVAIVVYAGSAGMVLPSTCADPKSRDAILAAIENLSAGGSTNGGQGIELAYKLAADNFIKGGTNRVILATDGDWNVGVTEQSALVQLIEDKAKTGVFLSVLGFGFGNLKDATMEKLADKGNGHYAYIDNQKEARKVLVEEMSGTLITIAKDVKIQMEFNPAKVQSYRLIGYENRMLRKEDFNNDKIDAGEIGAGHTVTALYEITPASVDQKAAKNVGPTTKPVDDLKYQKTKVSESEELLTLKLRYKQPEGDTSSLIEIPAKDQGTTYAKASEDFKFASAVAQYGMLLRQSPHKGNSTLDAVIELADEGKGKDEKGYRADFIEMVKKVRTMTKAPAK